MAGIDPPLYTLVGETADISLHRTQAVIRSEGINPDVTVEFSVLRDGILCGVEEVKHLLSKILPETTREVWMGAKDGGSVSAGEVVLRIDEAYASLVLHETALRGILGSSSGWATAARECVQAAGERKVAIWGASHVHPAVVGAMEYAAVKGGCVAPGTQIGARLTEISALGTIPQAMVLITESAVNAVNVFDKHMPPEVPRYARVGVIGDEAEEAVAVANELKDKLRGIHIDAPLERGGTNPELVKEVCQRLELAGFKDIDIIVSGGMTPTRIRQFEAAGAPVTIYGVGRYISAAQPLPVKALIKKIDGDPVAPRGHIPGTSESSHLERIM